MLYTFLPPILVVASLIGIIIFLLKKAHKVAGISSLEEKNNSVSLSGREVFPKSEGSNGNGVRNVIKARFLVSLEKIIRKIRVMFLKLENVFTSWSDTLKEKRKERLEDMADKEAKEGEHRDVIERINKYAPEKKSFNDRLFRRKPVLPEEEKVIRPLIKESYSEPRERVETKNQLESILIERIAANPKDTEAYERLGEYYFEIGNYNHSKECYKQVMKLNPRNIGARSRMKRLERLLGR